MRLDQARALLARDLNDKSDRACVIGVCASIDRLLSDACERNSAASKRNPRSLAARIAFAHQQSWIDEDMLADLNAIREIRNRFAHESEMNSLNEVDVESVVNSLRIPRRLYYDWGEIRAAEVSRGAVLYSGSPPEEALGDLRIGGLLFRMALTAILALLASELHLTLELDDGTATSFEVIDQLRLSDWPDKGHPP